MAILDVQNIFSDAQAVTATAFGTNFYDTTAISPSRDLGLSGARIQFTVDTLVESGGASTVTFEVIEADNSDGSGNTTVIASSGAIAKAALTAGATPFEVAIPTTNRRYIGVRYTVGTANLTAGAFTAAIVLQTTRTRNYPTGYPDPY